MPTRSVAGERLGTDVSDLARYGEVTLPDGRVIIFDTTHEDGWMQATSAVDLYRVA